MAGKRKVLTDDKINSDHSESMSDQGVPHCLKCFICSEDVRTEDLDHPFSMEGAALLCHILEIPELEYTARLFQFNYCHHCKRMLREIESTLDLMNFLEKTVLDKKDELRNLLQETCSERQQDPWPENVEDSSVRQFRNQIITGFRENMAEKGDILTGDKIDSGHSESDSESDEGVPHCKCFICSQDVRTEDHLKFPIRKEEAALLCHILEIPDLEYIARLVQFDYCHHCQNMLKGIRSTLDILNLLEKTVLQSKGELRNLLEETCSERQQNPWSENVKDSSVREFRNQILTGLTSNSLLSNLSKVSEHRFGKHFYEPSMNTILDQTEFCPSDAVPEPGDLVHGVEHSTEMEFDIWGLGPEPDHPVHSGVSYWDSSADDADHSIQTGFNPCDRAPEPDYSIHGLSDFLADSPDHGNGYIGHNAGCEGEVKRRSGRRRMSPSTTARRWYMNRKPKKPFKRPHSSIRKENGGSGPQKLRKCNRWHLSMELENKASADEFVLDTWCAKTGQLLKGGITRYFYCKIGGQTCPSAVKLVSNTNNTKVEVYTNGKEHFHNGERRRTRTLLTSEVKETLEHLCRLGLNTTNQLINAWPQSIQGPIPTRKQVYGFLYWYRYRRRPEKANEAIT